MNRPVLSGGEREPGRRAPWLLLAGFAFAIVCVCLPQPASAQESPPAKPAAPQQRGDDKAQDGPDDESKPPVDLERTREAFRSVIERAWVPPSRFTDGSFVRAAFRDVVAKPSEATVLIRSGGKNLSLGGVVGPDGWVLTKASRLKQPLTVRLKDEREFDARIVGVDRDTDLAILKVDAKQLPSLQLTEDSAAEAGSWVATPGVRRDPVAVGVVSVAPRKIPHRAGILGIQLEDAPEEGPRGALVVKVYDDTGAQRAGVQVNDVVIAINGQAVKNRVDLIRAVRRFSPGDELKLTVSRGDKRLTLKATLTGQVKEMFPQSRSQYQNSLGSTLSQRRYGFPTALQHDTVLKPRECGGPLVDLDGRVLGFNIARAGRTETFAIPTKAILPLMYKLMSGAEAPKPIDEEGPAEESQPEPEPEAEAQPEAAGETSDESSRGPAAEGKAGGDETGAETGGGD